MSEEKNYVKISELKPDMNKVTTRVRVLETQEPKTVNTRKGPRTISEAIIGDETGRTKLTLWGNAAGSVEKGSAIEIRSAWTSVYKGQVMLNIGGRDNIVKIEDEAVPQEEEIPEDIPRAPEDYRPPQRRTFGRQTYSRRRSRQTY